ncbi:MAG: WYL domain-containing protein [Gemmatimonadota bacterium]|nr:WYL domain-containing protein [Gemmatimonadota bacterium]
MKPPKLQRWIDLLAALLRHHFPVAFEQLIREVPAYGGDQSDDARRRMFERDKDELRGFGIPIETVPSDEGEIVGYRLRPRDFYLPYLAVRAEGGKPASKARKLDRYGYASLPILAFEAEELAAVTDAAARVRDLGDSLLAEHVDSAMRKLACDLPVDVGAAGSTRVLPPRAKVSPDLLAVLGDALARRKRVTFAYRSMGNDSAGSRTVEPLGLFFLNQHWYQAARTAEDATVKNYRLSRMSDAEVNDRKPGTPDYEVPAGFDLRAHARSRHAWELGAGDSVTAVVAFHSATGAAAGAAQLGEPVEGQTHHRRFRVRRLDAFARWLLSFAGDLEPVSPREIVDEYFGLARETLAHHASDRLTARPPNRIS